MKCPNKVLPEYRELIDAIGEGNALAAFALNNEEIPSVEDAVSLLGMKANAASTTTTLSRDTQEKLEDFLTKRGIDIINFTKEDALRYGKQWGLSKRNMAAGIADTVNGIIGLLEGKQDVAFGEEAAHMTVAMLKQSNPKLAAEMFERIPKMEIYKKVLQDPAYLKSPNYRLKDGKIDIEAIKEEAIGKLVNEHLANETDRASKLEDYERVLGHETPEKVSMFQRWFDKALQWFKQLFNKYDDNPFKETAKQMLGTSENEFSGTREDLSKDGKTLFQANDEREEKLDWLKKQNNATSILDGKFKYNDKDVRFKLDDSFGMKSNKYAKALGEKGKLDIKDILERYIDDDGSLRTQPLDKTSVSNLDPSKERAYEVLERNIAGRLQSFPTDTKFMHSMNIYNGGDKPDVNGKAASLDLLAMTSDGKAHIYNFEFIREGENVTDGDIPLDQQNSAREYMKDIKGILVKGYKINKFGESRTIPVKIKVNFSNNGRDVSYVPDSIEIAGVKTDIRDKAYVRPIPTFDERTGDAAMDHLIGKFIDLYKAKQGRAGVESKAGTLDQIARAIRHMQIDIGASTLAFQAQNAIIVADRAVADFVENVKNMDLSTVTNQDLAKKASALNMRELDLMVYKEAYFAYKDKYAKSTDEEKVHLDTLKEASDLAETSLFNLQQARGELVIATAKKWGIDGIEKPEKDMTLVQRELTEWSKPITDAQTLSYRILSDANTRIEHGIRNYTDELDEVYKDLQEWQKGKKYTDMLDLLKEKDDKGKRTNRLIKQYKNEFYEKFDDAVEQDTPTSRVWIRKNVNMEAFKTWLDDKALKKREEINTRYPKSERTPGSPWFREVQNVNKFNKVTNDKALYTYARKFPSKIWETDEFGKLSDPKNKQVKRYYDFIQKINSVAAESGYIDWDRSKRFLPFMYKNMAEKMMLGGKISLPDAILSSIAVSDFDLNYGQVDPITNERYMSLPKYHTKDVGDDVSNLSEDLIPNTRVLIHKVIEYKEREAIRPLVESILDFEKNKDSLQTNDIGKVIDSSEPKHDNIKNYDALRKHLSLQFYGRAYDGKNDVLGKEANAGEGYNRFADSVNKFIGMDVVPKVTEGKRYSLLKTLDAIKSFQVQKTLGLNISVPLYRMLSTNIQAYIQAGEYYNHTELSKAELRHGRLQFPGGNHLLQLLLMKTFLPVDTQLHTEARQMSMSKLTRDSVPDLMMKLTQRAHDWIQYVNFDAMINNAVVIDGKVLNARKYLKGSSEYSDRYNQSFDQRKEAEKGFEDKIKALIAEHGLVNKAKEVNGKLVVEGLDLMDGSVTKYMGVIRNMGLKLSGNITKENEINARRNAFVRQFFMFKSWIQGMVSTRYTPLSWKEGEDSYQWGRVATMVSIASDGLASSVGRMVSMLRATDKGVQYLSELYERKKQDYEDRTGKEFKMTQPEFNDMIRGNIQMTFKEIAAQLVLLSGAMTLYAAVKNIDKDKKGALAFTARLIDRSYEELNMYYNPASMQNMANGSLLPAMGFPLDITKAASSTLQYGVGAVTGDKEMRDKAHLTKHLVKLAPVTAQLPNWAGIIFPEYMKQLGYRPDAEQMHH